MTPVHLRFTPDRTDALAVIRARPTPRWHWWAFLASIFVLGMLAGLLGDTLGFIGTLMAWDPPIGEKIAVAAGAAIWFGVVIAARAGLRRLRARHAAAHATPVTLTADDRAVTVSEAGATVIYPWGDVRSAWLGRGRVFIALGNGRLLGVPARAFADEAAMLAFARDADAAITATEDREEAEPDAPAIPETAQ